MHHCEHCKQEIAQSPVAPIKVTIRDPEFIGPGGVKLEFCSWACAAIWFNVQAGEIMMPDLDNQFVRLGGVRW
jgi:hypothetical protein